MPLSTDSNRSKSSKTKLPGFDSEATPVIGVGLGLTGLLLGLRPRLAAWPFALTAIAALLYRDPKRVTPDEPGVLFAPADGTVIGVQEFYEHRFLHTDAVRIAIAASPFDVPVHRSPVSATVAYVEHVDGEYRPVGEMAAADVNERQYIGLTASWGPMLLAIIGSPLAHKVKTNVVVGTRLHAGDRLGRARFGARVDLMLPRDVAIDLPDHGTRVNAGVTPVGRLL